MNKYQVVIGFVIKAETRTKAWQEAEGICRKHLRDLANVKSVSSEPVPDPNLWIAVNEPIRSKV